jgi:hypothetical protein
MTDSIAYVYGIVASSMHVRGAPSGLEDAPVSLVAEEAVAALVSYLDAERFGAAPLERATADVAWLGARATEHDRLLTWVSDHAAGTVVPLPMFSLFRDEARVRAMLRQRSAELADILARVGAGREYAVRLYRLDAALRDSLGSLSPRIASLEMEAKQASPGQRYLLERKLDAERKTEMRAVGQDVARRVHATLSSVAMESATDPIPQGAAANAPGTLLSSTAFLVRHGETEALQRAVTLLVDEFSGRGFHLEFTGPWPPYHFAR